MPAPYNLSQIGNGTIVNDFVVVNTATDGIFGTGLIIAILMVLFLAVKTGYTIKKASATALFISSILSIFLFTMGMLPLYVVTILLIMTAISGFLMALED